MYSKCKKSLDFITAKDIDKNRNIYLVYIGAIILISIIYLLIRIYFYFYQNSIIYDLRDSDYLMLYEFHLDGLSDYYKYPCFAGFYQFYLYYFYFISYPFFLLPPNIGVYIWDICRIIVTIYIARKVLEMNDNPADLLVFFIISSLGYQADFYVNNTNWIIYIFLYISYFYLNKEKKVISGIFFALAMFKINVIFYIFVILLVRKIKLKELIYYIIPFALLCIPYFIFPDYLFQWLGNVLDLKENGAISIWSILLRLMFLVESAQYLFFSFLMLIYLSNTKHQEWKKWTRMIVPVFFISTHILYLIYVNI